MNAAEAARLVGLAESGNLRLVEGFHYRHHPLMLRAIDVVASGELGTLEFVEAVVESTSAPSPSLWQLACGGAMRHNGCYAIHALRTLTGAEPEALAAEASWRDGIDAAIGADLSFPANVSGSLRASMIREEGFDVSLRVRGSAGEMRIDYFFGLGPLHIELADGSRRRELIDPDTPTSLYQLRAFADSVQKGAANVTSGADIVANSAAVDATLAAAS